MTEAQWLCCTDPATLFDLAEVRQPGRRKLWLFCVAVEREFFLLEGDVSTRELLVAKCDAMERYVDGEGAIEDVIRARYPGRDPASVTGFTGYQDPLPGARRLTRLRHGESWASPDVPVTLCGLVREVFGPHFRPLQALIYCCEDAPYAWPQDKICETCGSPLSPPWRTPDVVTLARAAYHERTLPAGRLDEARLAVLADALEEAGLQEGHVLAHLHLRGAGRHVRGCWALDFILGKL